MRLAADRWEMEIRPERGGRIASLRLDGEELLDQGIGVDQPTAENFVEGGAWGWDEMVPNLDATDTLPDHGEAWRLPWTVGAQTASTVEMSCDGRFVPWSLSRRIELGAGVAVRYRYTNVGVAPHQAYWCAHPLFSYKPRMRLSVDIDRPDEGRSVKVFFPRRSLDQIRLGRVEMSWDSSMTPDVAVWICNGDLGGYRQIAVEPATSSPFLKPGQSLEWWLELMPLSPARRRAG